MSYYTVSDPATTYYTKTTPAMSAYAVSSPTTTYYTAIILAIKTWKELADQDAKTWAKLKELGLTTWKRLSAMRGLATFYHATPDITTTYYEVSV